VLQVANQLRAGMIHLNGAPMDRSAPFGGYKHSGNGRERGPQGFEEFLETKALLGAAQ
jgi:acyl-CoA reductase-like NAD-dependent aldehyde dehydrogenase